MNLLDYSDDEARQKAWRVVSDGYVGKCPHCDRERLLRHANGHVTCEKCNWDTTTNDYAKGKPDV